MVKIGKNAEVEITPSKVEGNIVVDIALAEGNVRIYISNDVTQSIHVLPDKEIGITVSDGDNKYTRRSPIFKETLDILEKYRKERSA